MINIKETPTRLILTGAKSELDKVSRHFRYQAPNYFRSPRYQTWLESGGKRGWDGYVYPAKWVDMNKRLELGRGHRDELLLLEKEGTVDLNKEALLVSPFSKMTVDDLPDDLLPGFEFELDSEQRLCAVELLKHGIGCIRATVSAGKTALLSAVAAMIRRQIPGARTLYLVPSERLVKQATLDSRGFLPDWNITQFGGGKKDPTGKHMVVATVATIHANYDQLVRDGWFKTFMVLLVDECAHAGSGETWREAIIAVPAFFRFGASDTLKNERESDIDKMMTLRGLLGPERHNISVSPLIHIGRVARPSLYLVDIPEWHGRFHQVEHKAQPDSPCWTIIDDKWEKAIYIGPVPGDPQKGEQTKVGWHMVDIGGEKFEVESRWTLLYRAYDEGIIRFRERNELVVKWAKHFSAKGWPTLIVATRTTHVYILQSMLNSIGLEPMVLTGADSSKKRDSVFKWLVESEGGILISPIVKEGVSLPELKAGIIADGIASVDLARQIIGRFIRKKPEGENEAHMVFFLDKQVKTLKKAGIDLFTELEQIRGYKFCYPCAGPDELGEWYTQSTEG